MTVTLYLKPELEEGLLARARANGMELEAYLLHVVEGSEPKVSERLDRAEAVSRMLEFGEKYKLSLGEPVNREALHDGHRF